MGGLPRIKNEELVKESGVEYCILPLLKQLGGFRFRVFLPISLFKFLMMSYQRLNGGIQFKPDQVDSLTAGEIFPNYAWWDEFNIDITSFEEGVKRMVECD